MVLGIQGSTGTSPERATQSLPLHRGTRGSLTGVMTLRRQRLLQGATLLGSGLV